MGLRNNLSQAKYEHVVALEGTGSSFCGWGVRDRGGDAALDKTLLCQNWSADSGTVIEWIRMRTGSAGGAGKFIFAFWQQSISGGDYTNVGTVTFDENDAGGAWGVNTNYIFQLENPIAFASGAVSYCRMSVYSDAANVAVMSAAATGSADSKVVHSDISSSLTYDFDSAGDLDMGASAEAFASPISVRAIEEGGTLNEENANWQNAAACTAVGWTNVANIYGAGVAVSSGGNGAKILIDLDSGGIHIPTWGHNNEFPDYSLYGVRAVSSIDITYELMLSGGLSIEYNDTDSNTEPLGAWEEIFRDVSAPSGAPISETIEIPVVARWLRITEIGTSITDEVTIVNVYQMRLEVTDGKFYVASIDDPHLVWLESYPAQDRLYYFQVKNKAGSSSYVSDPISNRKYKD